MKKNHDEVYLPQRLARKPIDESCPDCGKAEILVVTCYFRTPIQFTKVQCLYCDFGESYGCNEGMATAEYRLKVSGGNRWPFEGLGAGK
jgi:hypothetical protein